MNFTLSARRKALSSLALSSLALFRAAATLGLSFALLAASAVAVEERPVIEKEADLPRHSYSLDVPVSELYAPQNRDRLLALARQLAADTRADLEAYDIRDDSTIQGMYGLLGSVAMLEEDWSSYLDYLEKRRALETKEANRLTLGLTGQALAEAKLDRDGSGRDFRERFAALVNALPYARVEANLEGMKGSTEILSEALVLGSLESRLQPVLERNAGVISQDIAGSLVGTAFTLDHYLALKADVNAVLSATIMDNQVAKADIWAERQIAISGDRKAAKPVTIAVWDSGLDTDIFAKSDQLWINENEVSGNGLDDDDNGFVDDVHGIAYDLHANKDPSILYPLGDFSADEDEVRILVKGLGDIQFNIDSEAASRVRQRMSTLPREQVEEFLESLSLYGNYSHGTHVAGIAAEGNPFARLLATRMTYGYQLIPETPTLAQAHREAAMFLEVAEYFRSAGVRVVNMSWGGSVQGIEDALEANAAGGDPQERKELAREIFDISDRALRRAISESPEILFVTSSGNSDNDVRFDEFYPSSYDYPNLLTVGAVDSAGDETSFTSLGKVDVYGNGFEVESFVPGGERIAYNGTSMSSPQVTNLAGKLLALYPQLSVAELKALILDAAERRALETRDILLINPRASLELAKKRAAP